MTITILPCEIALGTWIILDSPMMSLTSFVGSLILSGNRPEGYDLVCSLYDQIAAGRRRISWQELWDFSGLGRPSPWEGPK